MGIVGVGAVAVTVAFLTAGTGSLGHHGASMLGGAARIAFAFPLGLLLHRLWSAGQLTLRLPALAVIAAVAALFFIPDVPGWNGVIDLAVVLLAFPVLTAAAVTATLSPGLARAAASLALLSYPLYILHGPIIMGAGQMLGETATAALVGGGVSLVVAWAAARWFDAPARAALGALLRQRRAAATAA